MSSQPKRDAAPFDSPRYDCALAAAIQAYQALTDHPGAGKALLVGNFTFIILDAIREAERRLHAHAPSTYRPGDP